MGKFQEIISPFSEENGKIFSPSAGERRVPDNAHMHVTF